MNEKALINGCKIELRLEQHYHNSMLNNAKSEEVKSLERNRHLNAIKDICDTYNTIIKASKELSLSRNKEL